LCPIGVAEDAFEARFGPHRGYVCLDAQCHTRVAVAHLRGGDRRVLAELGA
jgi:hypothetical protein